MAEILLVRHAQSLANKRDFTAFGNMESPLTDRGVEQAQGLNRVFREEFGIVPEEYDRDVAVSQFTRPQQTAKHAGFVNLVVLPLINESDVDREVASGVDVIKRHKRERWVPDETAERVSTFFDRVKSGEIDHEIFFSHGMFIAGFLLECNVRLVEVAAPFTNKRGYVPLQATITKVVL